MQRETRVFFNEARRRNFELGMAEGIAGSLLTILVQRQLKLTPTAEQRRRILGCTDLAVLERWLDRSLSVSSVAEILAEPAPVRRNRRRSAGAARNGRGRRK